MTVTDPSPRRISPTLRRWIGVGFAGAFGLLLATGTSWLAPPAFTESNDPSRPDVVHHATVKPSVPAPDATASPGDPHSTLIAVANEVESPARQRRILAALRAWARLEPEAAADWARSQAALGLTEAMTEIFAATEDSPHAAAALVERLAQADASTARDYGYALIFGLNRRGEFAASAGYATTAPEGLRRDLLIAAYHDWGLRQPELALLAAAQVADATARQTALQSALSGWARTDPEGLADTALSFPEGDEKRTALTKALRAWMIKDPWKAGDWILAHGDAVSAAEAALRKD
jgi:hypothetical protein